MTENKVICLSCLAHVCHVMVVKSCIFVFVTFLCVFISYKKEQRLAVPSISKCFTFKTEDRPGFNNLGGFTMAGYTIFSEAMQVPILVPPLSL